MEGLPVLKKCWDVLSSPEAVQWLGGIAGVALLTCFKVVRDWVKGMKGSVVQFMRGNGHAMDSKLENTYDVINKELIEIGVRSNAARVAIWQFHNGEMFSLSTPSFKLRSTFEHCREGVAPDSTATNDILVTKYMDIVSPLMDPAKKVPGVTDVTPKSSSNRYAKDSIVRTLRVDYNSLNYCHYKYYMDANGIDRAYLMLMRSQDGRPIGLFAMQYLGGDIPEGLLEEKLYDIYPSFNRIQFALDKSH